MGLHSYVCCESKFRYDDCNRCHGALTDFVLLDSPTFWERLKNWEDFPSCPRFYLQVFFVEVPEENEYGLVPQAPWVEMCCICPDCGNPKGLLRVINGPTTLLGGQHCDSCHAIKHPPREDELGLFYEDDDVPF